MVTPNAYKPKKWKYGVHPGIAMVQKWIDELRGKTGKDVEEWMKVVLLRHVKRPKNVASG